MQIIFKDKNGKEHKMNIDGDITICSKNQDKDKTSFFRIHEMNAFGMNTKKFGTTGSFLISEGAPHGISIAPCHDSIILGPAN